MGCSGLCFQQGECHRFGIGWASVRKLLNQIEFGLSLVIREHGSRCSGVGKTMNCYRRLLERAGGGEHKVAVCEAPCR